MGIFGSEGVKTNKIKKKKCFLTPLQQICNTKHPNNAITLNF